MCAGCGEEQERSEWREKNVRINKIYRIEREKDVKIKRKENGGREENIMEFFI